jgi:hypothetical protein
MIKEKGVLMKRRDFIRTASVVTPVLSMFPADLSGIEIRTSPEGIEKRSLGRTGQMLSMIGFGGIVVMDATTEMATSMVKFAIV